MYTRITLSGGRSYLQLVESFRTETGSAGQPMIANLGRLDKLELKDLDPLIDGWITHWVVRKTGWAGGVRTGKGFWRCLCLKAHGSTVSPKDALELLRRIQQHRATCRRAHLTGISKTTQEQLDWKP